MSKPEVTITLGNTGQVVRRGGSDSECGSKRSVEDTFEILSNKRRRGDGTKGNSGVNKVDDTRIGRNDLRLKLMHKSQLKQGQNVVEERKKRDSREKLSRATQHPVPQRRFEPNGLSHEADDLQQVNSLRKSHSSLTMNGSRARPPDRILKTSRGFSPPRCLDGLHQVPSIRTADPSRTQRFSSGGNSYASSQTGPTPIQMEASPEAARPVAPTTGIMQKSPQMVEEPLTVPSLLHSLGLGKYSILFQAEEVDMTVLKQMGDKDLKELGIPMGPRKKILLAVMPHSKRPPG